MCVHLEVVTQAFSSLNSEHSKTFSAACMPVFVLHTKIAFQAASKNSGHVLICQGVKALKKIMDENYFRIGQKLKDS